MKFSVFKLVFMASAVAFIYFLLMGLLVYYPVDVVMVGVVVELFTIPLILFVVGSFFFSLYHIIFKRRHRKKCLATGALNLLTITWMIVITLYF